MIPDSGLAARGLWYDRKRMCAQPNQNAAEEQGGGPDKLILIIEDDADIRDSLEEVLRCASYRVQKAENGKAALELLERSRSVPDLILLDLMMPVMDGWDFRQRQLERPEWRNVPVIVISAGGNVEQKAAHLSAVGWIKKPLEISTLLGAVERSLPRRKG
jgi:DNA-binding response OmpR family regulator